MKADAFYRIFRVLAADTDFGCTIRIMALTNAYGTMTGFRLLPGQARDLRGTAVLIEGPSCARIALSTPTGCAMG